MPAALHLATFSAAVTPPIGHPLCGGWIEPARAIDDPLRALGVVLMGPSSPVVLCAVDWCGIRNDANLAWRQALAKAAHTRPERVAVQCVHPHNAPFADTEALGLYRAEQSAQGRVLGSPEWFAVNLLDAQESRVAPQANLALASHPVSGTTQASGSSEIGPPLSLYATKGPSSQGGASITCV